MINLFLLNLAVGSISNYSVNIFMLKGIVSVLLIVTVVIIYKTQDPELRTKNPKKGIIGISWILLSFLTYLSITLIYSSDSYYGFQKILNFLISVVPSVLVSYYLLLTLTEERIKLFIYSIGIISILTVSYIIIEYPFDPGTIYEFRAGRWSHVIYGRMIGSIAVVLLLFMISCRNLKQVLLYSVISSIAIYGLYLSSLRSAMIGVVLFLILSSLFIVYKLIVKREVQDVRRKPTTPGRQLAGIILTIIITLLLIVVIPEPGVIGTRFDNLTQIEDFKFGGDEPINTRIEALKISKKLFLEHPVFGVGFGGYKNYNNFTEIVKYPHNIFIEMAVEGGLVGFLILCALLFVIFKYTYSFSPIAPFPWGGAGDVFFIFLLFALLLSMFSKELSNQVLLWIGLALYGLKRAD